MLNKMDNTVTHMMDMFKDNMSSDRGKAIDTIQREVKSETNPDGWTVEEVGWMIDVFTAHLNLAEAYLALNGPFRKNWVQRKVDIIRQQGWNGVLVEDAIRSLA